MLFVYSSLFLAVLPHVLAAPAPAPAPAPVAEADPLHPMVTARASLVDRTPTPTIQERGVTDYVGSILGDIGSAIPSYVASGVPNFFQDFPTGDGVMSKLGISSSDLAAAPTMVLNLP
jgi:hypothetical protein